ncbi:hypothetical protein M422DRAFT_35569 [Sphaerobolus stellatus SS14]|uniref:Unplaced genomic scaffold SPHSTscaffold_141, whole genome shotgun sequence n=1 Tax=Sphaerobolus stellatus (strain SS14) TaxID=990650 RepID=A0A0C9UVA8_SPHS4|nr:hypothetical protein M422DRAFT_35569 [Sphaerobolus stellatus SS14]
MRFCALPSILYAALFLTLSYNAVEAHRAPSAFARSRRSLIPLFGDGGLLPLGQGPPPPNPRPNPGRQQPGRQQPGQQQPGRPGQSQPKPPQPRPQPQPQPQPQSQPVKPQPGPSPQPQPVKPQPGPSQPAQPSPPLPSGSPSLPINPLPQPSSSQASLNLDNIQGDVLFPITTSTKTFFFFGVNNAAQFKRQLGNFQSSITTASQASGQRPATTVNIGFTQDGLNTLGVKDDLGDNSFSNGQINDVQAMGDPGTGNWVNAFTTHNVHGVFILASGSSDNINTELNMIRNTFGNSISQQYRLDASQRPGDQAGHEHFGFMDGISQPCVDGVGECLPGQSTIAPGVLILGAQGDSTNRPSWANGGSMMVFRQLQQLVPEFNSFLNQNAIMMPGFTPVQGADFLGARMFGRWQDGTPLDLSPRAANPSLASDPQRNNNFTFAHPDEDISSDQDRCPFAAHIRKTNPRADFQPQNVVNHIMRSSIAYGPEVSSSESQFSKTQQNRGLAFVCYQSQIDQGFLFQQQNWANLQSFPFGKNEDPGFDPIIGANAGQPRAVNGLDPRNTTRTMTLPDFVVSQGGAYFFFPPLSAMASNGRLAQ